MVELEVELPYAPSDTPQFVNELIQHIMKLLQNPNIYRDQKIRNFLCRELEILINLEGDDSLEERHKIIYEQLKHVLDPQGKVDRQVSHALTRIQHVNTASSQYLQQAQSNVKSPFNELISSHPVFAY